MGSMAFDRAVRWIGKYSGDSKGGRDEVEDWRESGRSTEILLKIVFFALDEEISAVVNQNINPRGEGEARIYYARR